MSGHSIAEIGQLLVADLGAAFGITNAPDKAMAFFQGVPVDDQIVQNGQLNPLRMKLWLAQFDTTLILRPSQATITPPPGGSSASQWYGQIVNGALPANLTGDAAEQFEATLAADRERYQQIDPSQPFESEPPDWPVPESQGWQKWDSSQHDTTTTTTTAGGGGNTPVPVVANPQWLILTNPQPTITEPPPEEISHPSEDTRLSTALTREGVGASELLRLNEPATSATMLFPGVAPGLERPDARLSVGAAMRLHWFEHINPVAGNVTAVTTTSDDVTIAFQYLLVTLRRTIDGIVWWDDALLSRPSWFVPGFAKGGLLAAGASDAVQVLPYALLIARLATVTGTWDSQQDTTHVGPLQVAVTDAGGGVLVSWDGMQAIGLLANVLPALPPMGDPQLDIHT